MGYLVVIEGTDGSGKQTQAERLVLRLQMLGKKAIKFSFPNYDSPSSGPVKMYLGGEFGENDRALDAYQASALYAVDRLCTYKKDIERYYLDDYIVVLDRYVQSNMLHQAGKIADRAQVDRYLDWLDTLEFETLRLPRPNKVIFLDVPVDVSMELAKSRGDLKTGGKKDIHEKDPEHLHRAYAAGEYVGRKYGWTRIECTKDHKMRTIEDISNDVYNSIKDDIKGK